MKIHPYAEVFPLIQGDDFDHVCRSNPVTCHVKSPLQLVTVQPSSSHPGYWHVQRIWEGGAAEETKRPMLPWGVAALLQTWGIPSAQDAWKESISANDDAGDPADLRAARPYNVVYFLQAGPFVKIGFTGGCPLYRISQLKTGCPYEIRLLATMKGNQQTERALHRRFQMHLSAREWFHANEELMSFIKENADVA